MDTVQASREIFWNVSSTANIFAFYLLFFLLCLPVFFSSFYERIKFWASGLPDTTRSGKFFQRLSLLCLEVLFQRGVNREPKPRLFHSLIFSGFLVLVFTTTMVFIDQDLSYLLGLPELQIYRGRFYLAVTLLSDVFGFLLLIGVAIAYHRRYIEKPDHLHNTAADKFMLMMLAALVIQGFLLEGLRIAATDDPWKLYSPIGLAFSHAFWAVSTQAMSILHFILWWIHTLTVFVFIALLPYTKFLHILSSTANLFFANFSKPKGALNTPGDIEALLEAAVEKGDDTFKIGISTASDFTWKNLLELDSCTSCGRCQDVCPAYNSGKILSPKWLILDSRNHVLRLQADGLWNPPTRENVSARISLDRFLLKSFLLKDHDINDKTYRASNTLVQQAVQSLGESKDAKISGDVIDEDVFWSCTTCRACMEVCPVGIEHIDYIVDVRRSMALMDGNIPGEAAASLRAIETRGNPFGPAENRSDWTNGLNIRTLKAGDEVDVLYWVGCVSAFDKRKQKIAQALTTIFNKAGINWGILGNNECCTGDPARRLGEENLFQTMAKKNTSTLAQIKFNTIVTNCPHCFNTFKNEYPDFGDIGSGRDIRIVHHSEYIQELLHSGNIKINQNSADSESITFHDPCYLGRYNGRYTEPRDILVKIGGKEIQEMRSNKEKALCCGAGGGHYFMDMKVGERVNVLRAKQAEETGASCIATGCPFCMQMMEDGVKITGQEESRKVRDIAELVVEALE